MTNTMQIFREQQFNNNERDTKMLNLNEQLFNTKFSAGTCFTFDQLMK